nr:MAG: RNA-dependent RNA polymerase [Porcine picobirnavirus]
MKKTQLTQQMLEVISNNNGLQRYLRSLTEGKAATPRSWLYEDLASEEVQKLWLKELSVLQDGDSYEQEVFQFDTSQLKKWGPQGEVKPIAEIMDIVLEGFGDFSYPKAFDTPEWHLAMEYTKHMFTGWFGVHDLRPASYRKVVDDMRARDVLESNSGWPLFTRRSNPEVKEAAIADAESGKWKEYPAIALFRNYNQKTRLVWMFPMATNLVEGSFYQPLYNALSKTKATSFFAPWKGFNEVRKLITGLYSAEAPFWYFIAASDFSSTDAHFRKATTQQVAEVLEACFKPEYRDSLHESLMHMHEIPLVVGPDTMITGEHGVASGSNWTNFVETVFDYIFSVYVAILQGAKVSVKGRLSRGPGTRAYSGLYAIGDDMSWFTTDYSEDFADKLQEYGESVGQLIKAEKTTNDRDKVKSLQRLFQRGYNTPNGDTRGVYSTIRALNSSLHPERFHDPRKWSSDMFCVRQFMILENCVDHPLFEEFVRFVCKGNRHLSEFARKSSEEQNRALRESRLLPGLNTTYNQEKRDSKLSDFASIRIAAKL